MKLSQFVLLKLAEECTEVAQRASKQIQFGPLEIQKNQEWTNKERLKQEIIDLMSVVRILIDMKEIEPITAEDLMIGYSNKTKKLEKYLQYSEQLGEIKIDD